MEKLRKVLNNYNIICIDYEEKLREKIYLLFTEDIIDEKNEDVMYLNSVGMYYKKQNIDKSTEYFEKAHKFADEKDKVLIEKNMLRMHDDYKNWTKALPLMSKLISYGKYKDEEGLLAPSGEACACLAFYYYNVKNDILAAKTILTLAIKKGHDYSKRNLTYFLIKETNYQAAIDELNTIDLVICRFKFDVYELYVECYIVLKDFEKAKEYYNLMKECGCEKELNKFDFDIKEKFEKINFLFE